MNTEKENTTAENKIVVYQVFTRLFGNKNKFWGQLKKME
jgi:hypothetical protein